MRYRDYLRTEGACSVGLGVVYAVVAFPGLILDYSALLGVGLAVAGVALLAVAAALVQDVPVTAPGRWFTDGPVRRASPAGEGGPVLSASRLRTRLLIETAIWVALAGVFVAVSGGSGPVIFASGVVSIVFGVAQLAGSARVPAGLAVSRRGGLGLPGLVALGAPDYEPAGASRS